jgi:hypothetical protein
MTSITNGRRTRFLEILFARVRTEIGFADVGSGGTLKTPWSLLPVAQLKKFDFEPTGASAAGMPLCISNAQGRAPFHVAHDERASSFHLPDEAFVARYAMPGLLPARTIEVERTTLDAFFERRFAAVDAMDVNVEGHDFQALQGAHDLLRDGFVKLFKVEFETASVWHGQGWLGDIDSLMRANGYVLAGIDFEFARAANVRGLFHRGEPLWGKALYVPSPRRWSEFAQTPGGSRAALEEALVRAIALFVAADLPGHAFDALDLGERAGAFTRIDAAATRAEITAIYRFAKLEFGIGQFFGLVRRALGLQAASNA